MARKLVDNAKENRLVASEIRDFGEKMCHTTSHAADSAGPGGYVKAEIWVTQTNVLVEIHP